MIESESWHGNLNWHLYHHTILYSAFSGMFVDVMPLFNHGSYILIKYIIMFNGENAVLRDKMSFFSSKYRVLH